jgi:hypothetical protein
MNLAAGNIRKGFERMELAHDTDPVNPMVLNHLAHHFFFTGQHFLVEQLTETALEHSRDHPLLKSQAYYNLARSYHSKVDSLSELPLGKCKCLCICIVFFYLFSCYFKDFWRQHGWV